MVHEPIHFENDLPPRRPRGLNFLLGGLSVAVVVAAYVAFGGALDFGAGAPHVRIDGPAMEFSTR